MALPLLSYSESTVPRKDNNWHTLVINANSIAIKKAELAIAEYCECDPDLMLISETKLGLDILNGKFVPEEHMGRFLNSLVSTVDSPSSSAPASGDQSRHNNS